jgi:hypothetical protein
VELGQINSLKELKRKACVELELYSTRKNTNAGSHYLMETTIQIRNSG